MPRVAQHRLWESCGAMPRDDSRRGLREATGRSNLMAGCHYCSTEPWMSTTKMPNLCLLVCGFFMSCGEEDACGGCIS